MFGRLEFAAVLDELIASHAAEEEAPSAPPSIPFDYLAVTDELYSGRIVVSEDEVGAGYEEWEVLSDDEFKAFLNEAFPQSADAVEADTLPSILPAEIAAELDLGNAHADDLRRIRRRFAFENHPDRVAPPLRDRAIVRMQVANQMIDEAERRLR